MIDAVGGHQARTTFIEKYVRPKSTDAIFDIGCGTGELLDYLPQTKYVGFDVDENYIEHARSRYSERGSFICSSAENFSTDQDKQFDIAIASGLMHHLDDAEAIAAMKIARQVLKPGGRLITVDGCYVQGQSPLAKFLISRDRGKFVRQQPQYEAIVRTHFENVECHVLHNMLRIPFTHVIFECS